MPVIRSLADIMSWSDNRTPSIDPREEGPTTSAQVETPDAAADRLQASLQDRLSFSNAAALLVGLTGCTPERAADALRTSAVHLDVHPARIARLFLECVMTLDDDNSEAFVTRLEGAASDADTDPQLQAGSGRPPADRSGGGNHSPASPAWSRTRSRPQLTATPILSGDLTGVTLAGELDLATVPLFEDAVAGIYRTAGARTATPAAAPSAPAPSGPAFLLNLADLTFLDASGLRALAGVHDRTHAHGMRLHVAAPIATAPRRLLRLAVGRGWLVPLFDTTDPYDPTGVNRGGLPGRP